MLRNRVLLQMDCYVGAVDASGVRHCGASWRELQCSSLEQTLTMNDEISPAACVYTFLSGPAVGTLSLLPGCSAVLSEVLRGAHISLRVKVVRD